MKATLALGMGGAVLGSFATAAHAADSADFNDVSMPGMPKPVKTEELFRKGVIGPAELSLAASKLGTEKATYPAAKEFAGFELTEAVSVTSVLKDLGTPVPPPSDKGREILAKLQSSSGKEFDRAFIQAQLENHEFLRDHAEDYLKNSSATTSPEEAQARRLATLALATFKEHVALCTRIKNELVV